jgi:putative inorganic carbon (HCO3(-)) transporter
VYLLMGHILMAFGRVMEFVGPRIGTSLHLAMIVAILGMVALFLSGGVRRMISSRITILVLIFTGWLVAILPFSIWRGGSVQMLFNNWLYPLLTTLLLSGLVGNLTQCRKAMKAVAYSTMFVLAMSLLFGSATAEMRDVGRFAITEGTFQNANDFAATLLIGAPFCLLMAMRKGMSAGKVIGLGMCGLVALNIVRTGSRSGLCGLALLTFLVFLRVSVPIKALLAFSVMVLVGVGIAITTPEALDRYRTMLFSDGGQMSVSQLSAIQSQEARKRLLEAGFQASLSHLLTGVGPGMFSVYSSRDDLKNYHVAWTVTHNTVLQLSSETGAPGLLIYIVLVVICFRRVSAIRKATRHRPELEQISNIASCLSLSLWAYVATALFASYAYYVFLPMLAGLIAAFEGPAWAEIRALEPLPVATASWAAPSVRTRLPVQPAGNPAII